MGAAATLIPAEGAGSTVPTQTAATAAAAAATSAGASSTPVARGAELPRGVGAADAEGASAAGDGDDAGSRGAAGSAAMDAAAVAPSASTTTVSAADAAASTSRGDVGGGTRQWRRPGDTEQTDTGAPVPAAADTAAPATTATVTTTSTAATTTTTTAAAATAEATATAGTLVPPASLGKEPGAGQAGAGAASTSAPRGTAPSEQGAGAGATAATGRGAAGTPAAAADGAKVGATAHPRKRRRVQAAVPAYANVTRKTGGGAWQVQVYERELGTLVRIGEHEDEEQAVRLYNRALEDRGLDDRRHVWRGYSAASKQAAGGGSKSSSDAAHRRSRGGQYTGVAWQARQMTWIATLYDPKTQKQVYVAQSKDEQEVVRRYNAACVARDLPGKVQIWRGYSPAVEKDAGSGTEAATLDRVTEKKGPTKLKDKLKDKRRSHGYVGVYWNKHSGKWFASLKGVYIGRGKDERRVVEL